MPGLFNTIHVFHCLLKLGPNDLLASRADEVAGSGEGIIETEGEQNVLSVSGMHHAVLNEGKARVGFLNELIDPAKHLRLRVNAIAAPAESGNALNHPIQVSVHNLNNRKARSVRLVLKAVCSLFLLLPMPSDLFSLKMRASLGTRHISGAEKIIDPDAIPAHLQSLLDRAMHHANGEPDFVNFKLERLPADSILHLDALPVRSLTAATPSTIQFKSVCII